MKCPECGGKLVRTMWEVEDGWVIAWLCECEPTDEEMEEAEIVERWIEKELERMDA